MPIEDIAFVVNFFHHPDKVTHSSQQVASCEGKKSSRLSNLFDEHIQPIMWLRDSKNHLYRKYKAEYLKTGRKQISETKFCQGHNAGNVKEMAQMVGLLTFVMRLENLDDIISQFSTAVSDKLHSEEVKEEFR